MINSIDDTLQQMALEIGATGVEKLTHTYKGAIVYSPTFDDPACIGLVYYLEKDGEIQEVGLPDSLPILDYMLSMENRQNAPRSIERD